MKKIIKLALLAILCLCSFLAVTACGEQSGFTVKFDGNGGTLVSGVEIQNVESASEIELPVYQREGYDFIGWDKIIDQIDSDTTVKAQWKSNPFTVTFVGNGGTLIGGDTVQTVQSASDIVVPTFTMKGHTLTWDINISQIVTDTTVTAIWTANEYKLNFDTDGGQLPAEFKDGLTVVYGQTIGALPTPEKIGFDFNYWQIGSSIITEETVWEYETDLTAEAEYLKETEYIIKYDLDGGKVSSNPNKYTKSSATFTLNNPTKVGYDFTGWYNQKTCQTNATVTVEKGSTGDLSFKAIWQAKSYTVTLDAGLGSCSQSALTVTFDSAVGNLPTCSLSGYQFQGWFLNGTKIEKSTVWKYDSNKTLVAEYLKAEEYSITYDLSGGNDLSNPNKYTSLTESFTLNNPTRDGYEFIGWTSAQNSTPKLNLTVQKGTSGNLSFKANWKASVYLLTFDAAGGTIDAQYENGKQVTFAQTIGTLPIPQKVGYEFVHWNIETETISKDTVWTHLESKTAIAVYVEEKEYSITYNLQGGSGATNPSSYKKSDQTFTLNNPTKVGYDFIGWTSETITEPKITVTIESGSEGNISFTANWFVRSYAIDLDAGEGKCSPSRIIVTYNQKIGNLPECTRDGYKFVGWYLGDVKVTSDTVWVTDGAQKLVAKYTVDLKVKIVLTCKFRGETVVATVDGMDSLPLVSVVEGQTLKGILPEVSKIKFMDPDEYSFYAWVNVNGTKITENTKITAENFPDITTGVIVITIKCSSTHTKFY